MNELAIVYTTCPDLKSCEKIALALLEADLAACVNRVGPIHATYRWEGKIEQGEEWILLIKTRAPLYAKVEKKIKELHPYSVPAIFSLRSDQVETRYLEWLVAQAK